MKANKMFAKMFAEPGFKIKHVNWEANYYIYYDDETECIVDSHGYPFILNLHNFHHIEFEPYVDYSKPKIKEIKFYGYYSYSSGIIWESTHIIELPKLLDAEGNHVTKTYYVQE